MAEDSVDALVMERAVQAAAREGLGRHRAAYPSMAALQARSLQGAAVAAVVMGVFTVLAAVAWLPLALIFGLPALYYLYRLKLGIPIARRNRGARLDLFERGLTVATPERTWAVRYADATVLQNLVRPTDQYGHSVGRTNYAYFLTDTAGDAVILRDGRGGVMTRAALAAVRSTSGLARDFDGAEEWGPAIQQAVTDARLPQAATRLRSGERLEFGPLWLTRGEIGAGAVSVPWAQVEEVGVEDGIVRIRTAGRWRSLAKAPVSTIPNFFVFRALVSRRLTTIRGAG